MSTDADQLAAALQTSTHWRAGDRPGRPRRDTVERLAATLADAVTDLGADGGSARPLALVGADTGAAGLAALIALLTPTPPGGPPASCWPGCPGYDAHHADSWDDELDARTHPGACTAACSATASAFQPGALAEPAPGSAARCRVRRRRRPAASAAGRRRRPARRSPGAGPAGHAAVGPADGGFATTSSTISSTARWPPRWSPSWRRCVTARRSTSITQVVHSLQPVTGPGSMVTTRCSCCPTRRGPGSTSMPAARTSAGPGALGQQHICPAVDRPRFGPTASAARRSKAGRSSRAAQAVMQAGQGFQPFAQHGQPLVDAHRCRATARVGEHRREITVQIGQERPYVTDGEPGGEQLADVADPQQRVVGVLPYSSAREAPT